MRPARLLPFVLLAAIAPLAITAPLPADFANRHEAAAKR